jgi:hypothetical protein
MGGRGEGEPICFQIHLIKIFVKRIMCIYYKSYKKEKENTHAPSQLKKQIANGRRKSYKLESIR